MKPENVNEEAGVRTAEAQPSSGAASGSASPFKNPHIIVGEPRRCICGVYDGEPLGCKDVLASLDELMKHANIRGSGVSLYIHDLRRIEAVIRPLVQECE